MALLRILHYPGSKWSMASWIISHMPEHKTYLEPFFGSGAVFFNKGPSIIEPINDMDSSAVNLFKVIRDYPDELATVKLLERYKRKEVLIYADPPYIIETRTKRHYKHEMTIDDHIELLEVLDAHPGLVLLSGYAHHIYDDRLKHWRRETLDVAAEAGAKRQEVLWINPMAAETGFYQESLF
ncbi:DNA adenine methylase [Metabacillus fastidiosus]|uniref:DNA adenine methylase n=1 Tax=Metabacillus fastidiosus TaxID=1458 RepID=UPI003D2E6EDF